MYKKDKKRYIILRIVNEISPTIAANILSKLNMGGMGEEELLSYFDRKIVVTIFDHHMTEEQI